MTVPRERLNALYKAKEFMLSLLDPKQTPKVPKKIRKEAYWVLRHFPADYELEQVKKKLPKLFGE